MLTRRTIILGVLLAILFGATFLGHINAAPTGALDGVVFHIEKGETITRIAARLEEERLIQSQLFFKITARLFGLDRSVIPGDYLFTDDIGTIGIVSRITRGQFGVPTFKITIPEGSTSAEIAHILRATLPHFDAAAFLELARAEEGYLFPDTYFFTALDTPATVIEQLRSNFDKQLASYRIALTLSPHSLNEVVTMASLVEKEASEETARAIIAGILWKRIAIGMPLQVDAAFGYAIGKTTYELTQADLKMDSPYNTYRYKGLPKGPIANPGLASLKAVLFPQESPYLYYLADRKGQTYYATDFEGHKANRAKYLN